MTKSTRITLFSLAGLAGLLALLALAALGLRIFIDTDAGRAWLLGRLEAVAASSGQALTVEHLTGDPLSAFRLENVRLADAAGPWLEIEHVSASWHPLALLHGLADIETLSVDGATLIRRPQSSGTQSKPASQGNGSLSLPTLPVDLAIGQLEFSDIAVKEAAVGTDAVLEAKGNLRFEDGRGYDLDLSGRRTDRADGSLEAHIHHDPADGTLDVDVALNAPAGGVVTNLLGVEGRPALTLTVKGSGPIDQWNGHVAFQAGQTSVVDLDISAQTTDITQVLLKGSIDPRPIAKLPLMDAAYKVDGQLRVDQGMLDIQSLALDGAPSSIRLFGSVDPARSVIDILFQVKPLDLAKLDALTSPVSFGNTSVDGRLSGPISNPNLSVNLLSKQVAVSGVTMDNLILTLMASRSGPGVLVSGTGGMDKIARGKTVLSERSSLTFDASLPGDFSKLSIDRLSVSAPDGALEVSGDAPIAPGPMALTVSVDLPAKARGDDVLGHLLAPGAKVSAKIDQAGPKAPLMFNDIQLRHPWITADGQAALEAEAGMPLAELKAQVLNPTALGKALGAPVSGEAAQLQAKVTGSWQSPQVTGDASAKQLTVAGLGLADFKLQLRNDPAKAAAQAGHLEASAMTPVGETGLSFTYAVPASGPVTIDAISLKTPPGTLTGAVTIPRDGTPITGSLSGVVAAGGALRHKLPLSGDLDLMLGLENRLGTQTVSLQAKGERAYVGPVGVETLKLEALKTADSIDFTLDATGSYHGQGHLKSAASLSVSGNRRSLLVRTLDLTLARHHMALQDPVRITQVPERYEVQPVTLTLDKGTAKIAIKQQAQLFDFHAALDKVPLGLLDLTNVPISMDGALSGDINLMARGNSAQGGVHLSIADMSMRGGTARIKGLAGPIDGTWDGKRLTIKSDIAGAKDTQLTLGGDLPLMYEAAKGQVHVPQDAPLNLNVGWSGEVAPLWQAVGSGADFLSGRLDAQAQVRGTAGKPLVSGGFSLSDGAYRNVDFGTQLKDIAAKVSLTPGKATIDSVTATDGGDGRLSAKGQASFPSGQPPAVDLDIDFQQLRAIARPDVTATVSGKLTYHLTDRMARLAGQVTTNHVEARLINSATPDVVNLNVTEVPAPRPIADLPPAPQNTTPAMMLDIGVDIPNQLFIRGRGLDSEWQGKLHVMGPSNAFTLTGSVNVVRGVFSFAGRRFVLSDGMVQFNGNRPINPNVSLHAAYDANGLTAIVAVSGTAKAPKIGFSSTPPMPQDEVVSNILFDKGVTNLSPLEAVQLAAAMRSLAEGGGDGIIGNTRSALGLDVLSFGSGDNGEGTVVRGGKYITKNVYVEVQSGTTPASQSVGVQVDISKHLTVDSKITETNGGNIGITWSKDY